MKKIYSTLAKAALAAVAVLGFHSQVDAQICPGSSVGCGSTTAWSLPGGTGTISLSPFGTPGTEKVFSVTPANSGTMTISVSVSGGYYVDLFSQAGSCSNTAIGWSYMNDILSGGTETSTMAVTGGVTYYFLLDDEDQSANSGTISFTCPGAPAANPCANVTALACGVSKPYTLASGNGAFNGNGPYFTPGNEAIFSFTAPFTGVFNVTMTHNPGSSWADLFFKSGACSGSGWTFIIDLFNGGTTTQFVNLTAGTTYLFMVDDEDNAQSTGTILITCPTPAPDPCLAIGSTSCGQLNSTTLASGPSAFNVTNCWFSGTPGAEKVYSFTAPTSGNYVLNVGVGGTADFFDYFYKPTSAGCGPTGWTCIDDISNGFGGTITFFLNAGTYYILVDKENFSTTSTVTHNWSISCPTPPPNDNCANAIALNYGVNGPYSNQNGTTQAGEPIPPGGSCNGPMSWCSFEAAPRLTNSTWFTFVAPASGHVTVQAPSFDNQLAVYSAATPCNFSTYTLLGAVDDDANYIAHGGSVFSAYVELWCLTPGATYYVQFDGYSGLTGSSTIVLNDGGVQAPSASAFATSNYACGYNISCNGASDGSASTTVVGGFGPYTYSWSNGATTGSISGVGAGTYTVTVTDAHCASTTASVTLTEPTAVTASCSGNTTVFPPYPAMSCATISANGGGGCGPYTYAWSDGQFGSSISVCPIATTTYTVTVTDANGCSATCNTTVCVVDVTCTSQTNNGHGGSGQAGNSGQIRITLCHIPPGNPGNQMTKCLPVDAVADHLGHGDHLGPCGFVVPACTTPAGMNKVAATTFNFDMVTLAAAPNPFSSSTTLSFSSVNDEHATLAVYTLTGVEVAVLFDGAVVAGEVNTVDFRTAVAEGVYIARLNTASGESKTIRLNLTK